MKRLLPILLITSLAASAEEPPKPKRAALGLESHAATQEEEEPLGLKEVLGDRICGVVVDKLTDGGAAAKAGIKAGDVLLQFGDLKLFTNDDLTDQVKVARPATEFKVRLKRAETLKEETVTVKLGEEDGAPWTGVAWTYAGPEQLDDALAEAKKAGKKVLVGTSGAETWWATAHFESGPLCDTLKNEAVVKASEAYVRILLRGPHATAFLKKHAGAEFPGLSVLNAEGDMVAAVELGENAAEVEKMLKDAAAK